MRIPVTARALVAGGFLTTALSLGAAPSAAASVAAEKSTYGGFGSSAWATPVHVEVYEPTIPVPAEPQLEAMLGYTKVLADSGTSQGKASYLWPGDAIGDGLPAFGAQLGLPKTLYEGGYPLQVNSGHPSGAGSKADEPFPGMVMRTGSGDKTATAEAGFSSDGAVGGPDSEPEGGGGDTGDVPSLPDLGGVLSDLAGTAAGTGAGTSSAGDSTTSAAAQDPGVPGLPKDLAALVDVEGYVSTSRTSAADGPVHAASRAATGEVSLFGGMITVDSIDSRARSATDGKVGKPDGSARYGTLKLDGQEFGLGPDGAVVGGKTAALPGIDAGVAQALDRLGISFEIPKPVRKIDGDKAVSVSEGLRIVIDTATLAPVLHALPTTQLSQLVPDNAGPLRSLVSSLGALKPTIVVTLGTATAAADTVPAIAMPTLPAVGGTLPEADGGTGDGPTGTTGADSASTPAGPAAPTAEGTSASALKAKPTSSTPGLPPLFSVPGMVVLLAMAAAAVVGIWFRRLGILALGGGAACAHGLETGLPDLRKA